MSTHITKDIICPQCGQPQNYRLYTGINVFDNPEMKEKILAETLFEWRCDRCNYFADMAYPFVYTDPEKRYVICVNPVNSKETIEATPAMESYIKRTVRSIAELKEKILIFDAGYDDVAMELVKNALCAILRNTYKTNTLQAYYCRTNETELEFAIFLPHKNEPLYHSTKEDVYKQSQEVLRTLDYDDPEGFSRVDSPLARKLLEEYKK